MNDVISVDSKKLNKILKKVIADCAPLSHTSVDAVNEGHYGFKKAKQSLHSLLISKLPEKKKYRTDIAGYGNGLEYKTAIEYNSALDDMRKSIDEMFGVQNG